jgi:hypothetical protein
VRVEVERGWSPPLQRPRGQRHEGSPWEVKPSVRAAETLVRSGNVRGAQSVLAKKAAQADKLPPEQRASMLAELSSEQAAAGLSGLGRFGDYGIPDPKSAAAQWSLPGVPQEIAKGFRYAHPFQAQDAYLNRKIELDSQFWYTGESAAAENWARQSAYAQPRLPAPQPWTNPWTAQQLFTGTGYPSAMTLWGNPGLTTPSFQQIRPGMVQRSGMQAPMGTAGGGGWPQPGQAVERF